MTEGRPESPRSPRSRRDRNEFGAPRRSAQRPAQRSRRADPARRAAYTLLRAVAAGAFANLEFPRILRDQRVSGQDAAFATELAYGSLRLRGRYDPILAIAADRPVARIDDAVLDTLRIGAHQALGMRVPSHAAVAETVALARQVNGSGAAGFVNAVLRRVVERELDDWLELIAPAGADRIAGLAVRQSHPEWIVKALRQALLGHGQADPETVDTELAELLAADNAAPAVSLVARPGRATVAELIAAGATPGRWSPLAATLTRGEPAAIPAVRDGRAAVQDEGSQLVALALATVPVPGAGIGPGAAGERWLDLCAGPGGKAGLLAALASQRDAQLVANEVSPHRAALVEATLAGWSLASGGVVVRVGDGREIGAQQPGGYDRVLVDAPCTGLGALRRRPEARWRRTPEDLAVLSRLQRQLLASALDATAPGGVVGYVTCSPHLSETVFAVSDVLKRRRDVEVLPAPAVVRQVAEQLPMAPRQTDFVQLWPHVHGTDGMFLALLRRHG